MKTLFLLSATALATGLSLSAAHAANWRNPYGNVNHANDAGNDTGDSQVDSLNAAQLDQNYWRSHPAPCLPGAPMMQGGPGGPAMGGAPQQ